MGKDTPTSIWIDEDIWKEAKKYAIDKGVTMKQLIESLLKKELESNGRGIGK